MKHLHIDRTTTHESRLDVVLYGHFTDGLLLLLLLLLFVSPFLVFYKSLTRKSKTSRHHTIFSFYEALIADIYAALQKASNCVI